MQGCLAGRVRPTNAIHLLPSHRRSLDTSGAIEDTSADEAAQTGNTETAVRDTGRNNYVAGNRLTSIVERENDDQDWGCRSSYASRIKLLGHATSPLRSWS
jgi:hypothetical protein